MTRGNQHPKPWLLLAAVSIALSGCGGGSSDDDDNDTVFNTLPTFIDGDLLATDYNGVSDDLLTAGLGASGLAAATAPGYADALNPTAAELRRNAIYNNYRALLDTTTGGGYGSLYGPQVDLNGNPTGSEGLIPGTEYLAYADDGSGQKQVALLVQIPDSFNTATPCILTAPSSGSRGIYGAIGTVGEWGLKRGCAIAYTDKGTGTGVHNLADNTTQDIQGLTVSADASNVSFRAPLTNSALAAFNAATPNRFAVKQAHSGQNAWSDWGQNVLQAVEFALYALNEEFGTPDSQGRIPVIYTAANTLVIASSVSNGGGASIMAAEQDERGLIDAVVVSEPNVQPLPGGAFSIQQGNGTLIGPDLHSKSLVDYTTLIAVYQPCAALAAENAGAPFNNTPAAASEARCNALRAQGLLTADSTAEQATEAQAVINAYGINAEQNIVQPSYSFFQVPQAVAVTYVNQHGRFGVADNLCGFSFGATDTTAGGVPVALSATAAATLFANSNGIPPTGGINLIYNDAVQGPVDHRFALSTTSGTFDQALDGFTCLRNQITTASVQAGITETRLSGDLDGRPTLIVTGRNDAILPINHASRPYYARNLLTEGTASQVRYYEVKNAQHLDAFNAFPGFNDKFIPLHHYFVQALNLMYDHLTLGTALPPSQVLATVPRGDGAPIISEEVNLPPISQDPTRDNLITFSNGVLSIPD